MKTNPMLITLPTATRDGVFVARYSEKGLAGLEFPTIKVGTRRRRVRGFFGRARPRVPTSSVRRWHTLTTKALKATLAGHVPRQLPPLDFSCGTGFQRRVWNALREIAPGTTRSYGEIARLIGRPKAVRAVGGACGANPIPVLVPCHRVLAANGGLGGFTAGLKWKRLLLGREGIQLD